MQADTEVFADFLFWCASESGTDNWGQNFTVDGTTTNVDVLPVTFGCDFGFRLGIDYCTCHDAWDLQGSYTWYRTEGKDSASTDGEITSAFLGNFYIDNADGGKFSGPTYRNASICWKITFNVFDLDLGRMFCPSECLFFRPYIGLKGGWIDQSVDTTWKNPTNEQLQFQIATEDLQNDFWGIGPGAGLFSNWVFYNGYCHSFSLFNDLSGALMYGHWTFSDRYKNDRPESVTVDLSSIDGAATMVRDFIGLQWKWEGECYGLTVRFGYEAQFWLGQLKFYVFNIGRLDNLLTLQGGTLDVRFAF